MIERHVQTIFCDDIRHEIGNKLSYIGVYSGELNVQSFPVALPKLCLAITIVAPIDKPLVNLLKLRVLKDDKILQEIIVDKDQLAPALESLNGLADDEKQNKVQTARFIIIFSPMQLDGPCVLRVRVLVDDEEIKGAGLVIKQTPPQSVIERAPTH